jgi:hypothetical protein
MGTNPHITRAANTINLMCSPSRKLVLVAATFSTPQSDAERFFVTK